MTFGPEKVELHVITSVMGSIYPSHPMSMVSQLLAILKDNIQLKKTSEELETGIWDFLSTSMNFWREGWPNLRRQTSWGNHDWNGKQSLKTMMAMEDVGRDH